MNKEQHKKEIRWLENEVEQLKICSQYIPIKNDDYYRLMSHIKKKENHLKEIKEGENNADIKKN